MTPTENILFEPSIDEVHKEELLTRIEDLDINPNYIVYVKMHKICASDLYLYAVYTIKSMNELNKVGKKPPYTMLFSKN